MQGILPYLLAAALYAALGIYFWRSRWTAGTPGSDPLAAPAHERLGNFVAAVPLLVHGALVAHTTFPSDGIHLGVGNAISLIVWLAVLIYWLGNIFQRLDGLQALVMPVAAVAVLLPLVLPAHKPIPNTDFPILRLHLLISLLAYSLFTIASLHVLLMALIERSLHHGAVHAGPRRLPPLLTMEALLFRIIWAGFVLLTLTLLTGIVFSEELFGRAARFNHKTVFGVLSWLIFAALLSGRHFRGWRGRIAVRWTLTGFFVLVLAYIGSKFVLEVLLGRV